MMQSPGPSQDKPEPPQFKISPIWWAVLAGLLIWNLITYFMSNAPAAAEIPYSTFIEQVRAGNVSAVTIAGDVVTGKFVNPISWPQPTPGATPTGTPQTGTPQAATPQAYQEFHTFFPATVGDTNLMPLLQQKNIEVDVLQPSSPWFIVLLTDGLPILLLLLVMGWMGQRAMKAQSGLFSIGRTRARKVDPDMPQVTFEDVAGADEAKTELMEVVDFLKSPKKYHDVGARIPRGVLLVGPPGTGKTLMARAVAGEAGVPFYSLSASEFVEMFVGVGASRVRDLFAQAKQSAPAIVFIDELDAVGRRRGAGLGNVNDEREQTLNQLLVEMDGFDERQEVILLAATNRPDVLDPALLRPGRFDREVVVGRPTRQGRLGILKIHTSPLHLSGEVDLNVLAGMTVGMSGADLANLCNEAALTAARNDHPVVMMADFEAALDKIILGGARPLLLNPKDRQVVAYHEAGHAVMAWFTPGSDPVHKVTIVPHGQALGVTEQSPGEDIYNYSKGYLLTRLAVMLGGRVAEEIVIGEITTGAENDLVQATRLARRMVTRWAMTDFGLMALDVDEEQPFLGYQIAQGRGVSEATASRVDGEVQRLLKERYEYARKCLTERREALDTLVKALIDHETVSQESMRQLLGPPA